MLLFTLVDGFADDVDFYSGLFVFDFICSKVLNHLLAIQCFGFDATFTYGTPRAFSFNWIYSSIDSLSIYMNFQCRLERF